MQVTISTKTHYEETTRKGIGYQVKIPEKTAARWREVLESYELVRAEMESYYKAASDEYFATVDSPTKLEDISSRKIKKKSKK